MLKCLNFRQLVYFCLFVLLIVGEALNVSSTHMETSSRKSFCSKTIIYICVALKSISRWICASENSAAVTVHHFWRFSFFAKGVRSLFYVN